MSDELSPKAWEQINEAVGEALGVTPPDPAQDRVEGAPPHGASPAKLVPGTGYDPITPVAQQKVEENGVRFQQISQINDLQSDYQRAMIATIEADNRKRLSQAMALFHADGSLMGEYAPMQAEATTPDTVDGLWWLALPRSQAMWELGIDKDDDATYSRVRRDIEAMASIVVNRMLQTHEAIPMVIRRRKRRFNSPLFSGGNLRRLKPVLPDSLPPPGTPRRRTPKPSTDNPYTPI